MQQQDIFAHYPVKRALHSTNGSPSFRDCRLSIAQNTAYRGYSLSEGNKGTCAIHFRDCAYSTTSLRISNFHGFYPARAVTLLFVL